MAEHGWKDESTAEEMGRQETQWSRQLGWDKSMQDVETVLDLTYPLKEMVSPLKLGAGRHYRYTFLKDNHVSN